MQELMPVFFLLITAVTAGVIAWNLSLRRRLKAVMCHAEGLSAHLEERTKASEQKKKQILAILESMTEGVVVTDTAGRVTLLNSVLSGILGISKEETVGRYFWEIFRDPEINKTMQAALADHAAIKKEHAMLLSDSVYQIQISPVFLRSDFLGVTAVFYDLTKIKELERTRSEFVANVSHELKTPLTSIIGFVETLKEGAIEDPEHRGKFIRIIDEHSQKLHLLIEDLLFLSKLESGKDRLKKEVVDLEKTLEKITTLLKRNLEIKKIELEIALRPKPFLIYADGLLVEQALTNLLDNAIKYNKPGGKISIHATQGMHGAVIRIKDTGIGIPAPDLQRIFERFYRVDKSRSRESGGTGLGLSIVKHIVEKHTGTVEVNSAEDKGTTFTITLPAH